METELRATGVQCSRPCKRSYKRALTRALLHGGTVYGGKRMTSDACRSLLVLTSYGLSLVFAASGSAVSDILRQAC